MVRKRRWWRWRKWRRRRRWRRRWWWWAGRPAGRDRPGHLPRPVLILDRRRRCRLAVALAALEAAGERRCAFRSWRGMTADWPAGRGTLRRRRWQSAGGGASWSTSLAAPRPRLRPRNRNALRRRRADTFAVEGRARRFVNVAPPSPVLCRLRSRSGWCRARCAVGKVEWAARPVRPISAPTAPLSRLCSCLRSSLRARGEDHVRAATGRGMFCRRCRKCWRGASLPSVRGRVHDSVLAMTWNRYGEVAWTRPALAASAFGPSSRADSFCTMQIRLWSSKAHISKNQFVFQVDSCFCRSRSLVPFSP